MRLEKLKILRAKGGWVVMDYLGDRGIQKLYEEVIRANFEGIITKRHFNFGDLTQHYGVG
ncbi:hypothetical protein [Bacillus cereus]|uniref:hypothetical protein n=1 Tax=Bacillus cereus TaxID=1396 RepID=UPI003D9702DB